MRHRILADIAGTVAEIAVATDAQIGSGDLILRIEPEG